MAFKKKTAEPSDNFKKKMKLHEAGESSAKERQEEGKKKLKPSKLSMFKGLNK